MLFPRCEQLMVNVVSALRASYGINRWHCATASDPMIQQWPTNSRRSILVITYATHESPGSRVRQISGITPTLDRSWTSWTVITFEARHTQDDANLTWRRLQFIWHISAFRPPSKSTLYWPKMRGKLVKCVKMRLFSVVQCSECMSRFISLRWVHRKCECLLWHAIDAIE